jgi:hypothetical protein
MLQMCRSLGFKVKPASMERDVCVVTFPLA